jgi:hypothetical protein
MSCRPWGKFAPDPETPHPVTPTKPPHNAGAGHYNPDAENSECEYDSDEPFRKKKKTRTETKKRERRLIVYVRETVSERKQCKKVSGLAGRRKRRVLEERQDDEKVIHSNALLLAKTPPPAAEAGPSPRDKAAVFVVPEAVLPSNDDEDDDFQVTFTFSLWCHGTDSSYKLYRIREPRTSDHGRGGAVANSS